MVLALIAMVSAQQVITNFEEFKRKQAEYEKQKAVYDEYQNLRSVPLLAGYDLIPKVPDSQAAPGNAEQLLPEYKAEKIDFHSVSLSTYRVVLNTNTRAEKFEIKCW